MKKGLLFIGVMFAAFFTLCGCGVNALGQITKDDGSGVNDYTLTPEDNLNPEDIVEFEFEGENFCFPVSLEVFTERGWTISDFSYSVFDVEDILADSLRIENSEYPGVYIELVANDFASSIDELVENLISGGSDAVYIAVDSNECIYPEFSIKGISFGDSVEELEKIFGSNYNVGGAEQYYYAHSDSNLYSHIGFKFDDDRLCEISVLYNHEMK